MMRAMLGVAGGLGEVLQRSTDLVMIWIEAQYAQPPLQVHHLFLRGLHLLFQIV